MKPKKISKAKLTPQEKKLGVPISHLEEFKRFKEPVEKASKK
jgi:hypothetical protein